MNPTELRIAIEECTRFISRATQTLDAIEKNEVPDSLVSATRRAATDARRELAHVSKK